MSALRVVGLGFVALPLAIVGAMWKKKKIYTVIEYNDDTLGQTLVFDFGKHLESKQEIFILRLLPQKQKRNKPIPNNPQSVKGSGTTGIAALNLNRKFIGIEIDKRNLKLQDIVFIISTIYGVNWYEYRRMG